MKRLAIGLLLLLSGCSSQEPEAITAQSPTAKVLNTYRTSSSVLPGRYESSTFYATVQLPDGSIREIAVTYGLHCSIWNGVEVILSMNKSTILGKKP